MTAQPETEVVITVAEYDALRALASAVDEFKDEPVLLLLHAGRLRHWKTRLWGLLENIDEAEAA